MIGRFLLLVALAATLAMPAAAEQVDTTDRAAIEKIVREYLLKHPEVIVEALQEMQAREEQAAAERARQMIAAHRTQLDDPSGAFVVGNANGDVTVVEFFDYRCGYCKRVMPGLLQQIESDGGVRLVLKEFPILGPDSVLASRAAVAATRQDRYYDMHVALMRERGAFTEEKLLAIGRDLGLDVKRMQADMYAPETEAVIARNHELARILDISGTPGFVIGDRLVPGAISAEQLQHLIDEARRANG